MGVLDTKPRAKVAEREVKMGSELCTGLQETFIRGTSGRKQDSVIIISKKLYTYVNVLDTLVEKYSNIRLHAAKSLLLCYDHDMERRG